MTERPHLNPHRDRELQVGRAADRFEAGPSTVKAARIDPVVTRGRMAALGAGAWRDFKDWRSMQGNPSPYGTYGKERFRPPAISTDGGNVGGIYRNLGWVSYGGSEPLDPRYGTSYWGGYDWSGWDNLATRFDTGDFVSVQDAHQEWNSHNASTS